MSTTKPASIRAKPPTVAAAARHRLMRQIHLWVGAWGAIAALLFGLTGLVLNHRFGDSAWPQGESKPVKSERYSVPAYASASAEALSSWLRATHGLDADVIRKPKPEPGAAPKGPQKWTFSGGSARNGWSADYSVGSDSVEVKWSRSSPLAVFNKLHKSVGGGWLWRLLVDSYAVAMILLAITGIWMWARGRSLKQMVLSVLALALLVSLSVVGLAFA